VEQIFRALNEQTDLTPDNPQIHPHLARLVDIAKEDISLSAIFKVLGDKRIENILPELWNKLALIEGEIEIAFTNQQCLNSTVDLNDLLKYNYTGEYEQLVNMELDALFDNCPWLDRSNASSIRFIMIGAGSFPMSAILFHKITGSKVTCVDVDPRAVELAKTLVSKLGLNEQINVEFSNGDRIDLEGDEIVWIASLVQGKSKVLRTVSKKLKKGAVAVRSADGLYGLMYEPIDRSLIVEQGLVEVGHTHSNSITVNSTFYYASNEMVPSSKK